MTAVPQLVAVDRFTAVSGRISSDYTYMINNCEISDPNSDVILEHCIWEDYRLKESYKNCIVKNSDYLGLFLTYMDEESSFFLLDSLLKYYNLEGFFLPNFLKLKGTFYIFLNLLKKYMPKVYTLFKKEELVLSMYATEWFICVFSRSLKFNSLVRVFDVFLLEGYTILYRIALAFIKINENKFLEKNAGLEYFMEVFKTLFDDIDPDLLIKTAFRFSITVKTINKLEKEYKTVKNDAKNEFVQQL